MGAWAVFCGIFATFAYLQHDEELEAELDRIAGPMPAYSAGTPIDRWRLRRAHRRRRRAARARLEAEGLRTVMKRGRSPWG